MISRWYHGYADEPPYKAPAVLYLGDSRDRGANGGCRLTERALQAESPLVRVDSVSPPMRTATAMIHIDRDVTNNHCTQPSSPTDIEMRMVSWQ